MNLLEQLRKMTVVVADTGDFESIARYNPVTRPRIPRCCLKAAQMPQYRSLLDQAIASAESEIERSGVSRSKTSSTSCSSASARKS